MKKIILFLATAFAVCGMAKAVVVQKLILKNGSELSGYIQKQDGKGNLTFASDCATIYLNSHEAQISNEQVYNIKSLDKDWIEWAEKNDAFRGAGDNRSLILSDVSTKGKSVSKVRILERGTLVKYIEMAPNIYSIAWKDVKAIKGEKRSKTALSGINRIYQLKNGAKYEGEYAEETDSTLSLLLNNGIVQSFPINEVVKYTFRPVNPTQSIFAQSELLDVIKTTDNNEIKGIIIEQNYTGKNDSENYFLIQQESGAIQSTKISDISETRKEENPLFAPKFDILLKEGEVVVNRKETVYANIQEMKDILVLDNLKNATVVPKGENNETKFIVEYHNPNGTNIENFQLIKTTESIVKKKIIYSFSYKDLVNAVYRPISLETSVNRTTKAEYIVGGQGVFALYDAKLKRAIPIIVK